MGYVEDLKEREQSGFDLALAVMYGWLRATLESVDNDGLLVSTRRKARAEAAAFRHLIDAVEDTRVIRFGERYRPEGWQPDTQERAAT